MKKIPKSFECGGRTVRVKEVLEFDQEDRVGDWRMHKMLIRILATLNRDVKSQTFWHEAFHVILETSGNSELSSNEDFVESVSQLIWQVIKTSK
jgi:hypothetical protein